MEKGQFPASDIEANKQLAALSYLWVFSLIMLMAKQDSPFVRFHARQGFVLFIFSILLWPVGILRYGEFLVLALMILGFIEAASGNSYLIPIIGDIAGGQLGWESIKRGWHATKHIAIGMVKPEHVTPEYREILSEQQKLSERQQSELSAEEKMIEREEKKLSALLHRLEEDEKKIQNLEEQLKRLESEPKLNS